MILVDLSHKLHLEMPTYPTDPKVEIRKEKNIKNNRSNLHVVSFGTHTGTHMDAPYHVIEDGKSIDNFSLDSFCGRAVKITQPTSSNLSQTDQEFDGVILDTGWYKKYDNPQIYFGNDRPEISEQLIENLVEKRIKFFCCDLPSVDKSGSIEKPIHNLLLSNDVIIYESLTNLNALPLYKTFDFYGFPFPFVGLDGSPVRAVAMLD